MAVKKVPTSISLQIAVQSGTDSDGNPKYTTKSFSGIKANATSEDILAVGNAIGAVLANDTNGVFVNTKELVIDDEAGL